MAAAGAVLLWMPLLAPVVFGLARLGRGGPFMVDWLMPAEVFPVALLGGLLLFWAARRARSWQRPIGWGLLIAVALLVTSQVLAVATGLADGTTDRPACRGPWSWGRWRATWWHSFPLALQGCFS